MQNIDFIKFYNGNIKKNKVVMQDHTFKINIELIKNNERS